jgi:hypothetical protein
MRASLVAGAVVLLFMAGCSKPSGMLAGGAPSHQGRFEGVGIYSPGRMWEQLVRAGSPTDAVASTLKDDEQVIVVIDSRTGEVRQCGNLSGYCVSMNPWTKPLAASQQAPLPLLKHSEQLDQEAETRRKQVDLNITAKVKPQ